MWLKPNNLQIKGSFVPKERLSENAQKALLHRSKSSSLKAWKSRFKKYDFFKTLPAKIFLDLDIEEYVSNQKSYLRKKKQVVYFVDGHQIKLKNVQKKLSTLSSWKEKTKHIRKSYREREEKSKEKSWSTPLSRDYKGHCSKESQEKYKRHSLPEQAHSNTFLGKLNPRWVETLMGVPIGWTAPLLKKTEMNLYCDETIKQSKCWPTPTMPGFNINPSELKDRCGLPWKGVGRGYKNGLHRTITLQTVALAQKKSWSTPVTKIPQENPKKLVNKDGTIWDKQSRPYRKSGAKVSYNVLLQAQLEIEKKAHQEK